MELHWEGSATPSAPAPTYVSATFFAPDITSTFASTSAPAFNPDNSLLISLSTSSSSEYH